MSKLGFVEEDNENDKALCELIHQMLSGRVTRRNLLVFLSQIEKVH